MTTTINSPLLLLLLVLRGSTLASLGDLRAMVSSSPYSITLSFQPRPEATNYTASFRVYNSPFLNDVALDPPYNQSVSLNASYYQVSPGLNYTVTLYENGTSGDFIVFSQHIATVPLAPINLQVEDRGSHYLTLSWDSIQNISYSSHRIYFRQGNESQYRGLAGSLEEWYNLGGLQAGRLYHMYVTAIAFDWNEDKESQPSVVISTPTLPGPPTNLTAQADNDTHITVTWLPQEDSFQDWFQVTYLAQGSNTSAACRESPCSLVPGGPAGQEVVVFVSSVSHGVSSKAQYVKTSTEPEPVSDLQAVEGVGSLELSWRVPSDTAISSYLIRLVNIPDNRSRTLTKMAAGPNQTRVTLPLTGLTGGSVYQVYVYASTPYAQGQSKTDVFRTIPEPVAGLQGMAINTTAFQLIWTNPRFTVIDDILISVLKPDGNVTEIQADQDSENQEVVGLIPGETYQVSVFVHTPHTVRISEPRNVSITTKPVMPRLVSSISGETFISVVVSRHEDLGVFSSIQVTLDSGTVQTAQGKERLVFDLLTPGTDYRLDMVTRSGQEKSEVTSVTVYTKPRPPQNLEVEAVNSTVVRVTWGAPDGGGYDQFEVILEQADGASQQVIKTTSDLDVDFTGVMAGTTYNVSVATVKGNQESDPLTDQNTTAPLGITNIRVSVRGVQSVTLTWDPPVGSNLQGFALTFDLSNVTLLELPAAVSQYRLEGLEADTNYTLQMFTFALRAGDGVKLYSPPKRFNFSTYPESVAALHKVEASESSIGVNWTDPAVGDFNGYTLGIKEEVSGRESRPLFLPRSYTNYTFESLLPGKVYLVAIRTVLRLPSGRQRYGILVRLRAVTRPLPVDVLQVFTLNTTALRVNWTTHDNSSQDKFLISYQSESIMKTLELVWTNSSQDYQVTLTQLLAGSTYTVQVTAVRSVLTDSEDSQPSMVEGNTKPNPVSNLTLVRNPDASITVSWDAPSTGRYDLYHIQYRPVLRDPDSPFQLITSRPTSRTLVDLFPGESYQVRLASVSHGLESDFLDGSLGLEPLSPERFLQVGEKTTTSSVTVHWSYQADRYYTHGWLLTYTDGSTVKELQEVAMDSGNYSRALTGLTAGQTYTVTVQSVVMDLVSGIRTLTVTAKPLVNTALDEMSTSNQSVTFGYTVRSADIFQAFVFSLEPPHAQPLERGKNETVAMVTMDGLEAGTRYMLYAFTKSGSELSSGYISLEFLTDPNPVPVEFMAMARQITLVFGDQQGSAAQYLISCVPDCGQEVVPIGTAEVPFLKLKPFSSYIFKVTTKTMTVNERHKEVTVDYEPKTLQAAPSEVRSLTVTEKSINSVNLSWQMPLELNGVLKHFILSFHGREKNFPAATIHKSIQTLSPTTLYTKLQGLKAGYSYTFQVFARTVADGPPADVTHTMLTASPTFKSNTSPESSKPSQPASGQDVTQKAISLQFVNPFSTEAGYVRYYSVIVSRDPDADDNSVTLPSWEDANTDQKILVYEAVSKCQDFFMTGSTCGQGSTRTRRSLPNEASRRQFVVGEQTESECQGQAFCNGPLSAGTGYYVKLRGFTQSGQYQDTAYSEKVKTENPSASSGGVVGGVVGALVGVAVAVAVVAGVVVRKRQRRPRKASKHSGARDSWEQSTMNNFSRPVKLAHFPDHVHKMAADSDFKYAEEYEDLKETGRDQPTLAAEFPPNRPKNRFTNILPYDHSRVKLLPTDDEEGSDYINANYMPGYNSKREYIATQGPLPATRDDFWRMLWEQCSRNIVMLTRCQEKGREKSDHYWPSDSEPKFYGDLQVIILNETHMPDWTIVEFKVSHGDQSRQVRHFHYRVWPDFGVPKDPASIIRFVRTVREKLIREGGPIILHCSAGVGRSGTFIVLDHLLQLIREKDEVDIYNIVYKLRKERVLMVQTEQQYKFIHECLLCVLENRENDTTYANLGQVNVGFEDDEGINLEGP